MNQVKIPEPSFSNTSEARERLPIYEEYMSTKTMKIFGPLHVCLVVKFNET